MKAYWVAYVDIKCADVYANYLALAPKALQKYKPRILARGEEMTALEGFQSPPDRAVIFEFESYEKALACYYSKEYQHARLSREGAAEAHILIIKAST